jgi:CPA2 family monovalent cation:H+ antiporter-2
LSFPLFRLLLRLPLPSYLINGLFPLKEILIPDFKNHIVIIGKDASAIKLSSMATKNKIKHISIVFDPSIAKEKMKNRDLVVYGDAVNEPVLKKAHTDTADIVVISVGSIIPSMTIIQKVRNINNGAYILVRSPLMQHVGELYKAGADQVLPEKLEIALDLLNRILVKRIIPQKDINRILTDIRISNLGVFTEKDMVNQTSILDEFSNIEISQIRIGQGSEADGKSPIDIELRKKTGVTLLAIKRGSQIMEHPAPDTLFQTDDIAYVLGDKAQVEHASSMMAGKGS